MYEMKRRMYLTQEAGLIALLRLMEVDPAYRPGKYPQGEAGLSEARAALADMRALLEGFRSEGDD